ncbi:MAG: hypothetical protein KBD50_02275 [Candidatus Pacebacteria bacterium]|nr:hypothetical protein [Candidatus Paceibacterota bacterium]
MRRFGMMLAAGAALCMTAGMAMANGHGMAPANLSPIGYLWFEVSHFFMHLFITAQAVYYAFDSVAICQAMLVEQMHHAHATIVAGFFFATPEAAILTFFAFVAGIGFLLRFAVNHVVRRLGWQSELSSSSPA